jgi:hypothetical protein
MKLLSLAFLVAIAAAVQLPAKGLDNNYFAQRFIQRAQASSSECETASTVKALIRAQVYDTLEDAGIFDRIDDRLRNVLRPLVKLSREIGN